MLDKCKSTPPPQKYFSYQFDHDEFTNNNTATESHNFCRTDRCPELNFLRKFSTISADYENDKRSSAPSFILATNRASMLNALIPEERKRVISEKLWTTTSEWKMENIYLETVCILYPTPESREKQSSKSLMTFLQTVFHISQATHEKLITLAKQKSVTDWVLNLELIEAKGLPPTDINGLSDPYCTLSMSTKKEQSYRTTIQEATLEPVWNAFFTIPIVSSQEDILKIDVWDYDPEQPTREKLKNIGDLKSSQAWKAFIKDITAGKTTQEFIGRINIPLKEVEFEVIDKWFPLENCKSDGQIHLRMAVGPQKDKFAAIGLYRQALQLLLIYHLERTKDYVAYEWAGKFPQNNWSDYILRQMAWSGGLKPQHIYLANWLAFTQIHLLFPLSFEVFLGLFSKNANGLASSVRSGSQEYKDFWESTKSLLDNLVDYITSSVGRISSETVNTQQLNYALRTVQLVANHLSTIEPSTCVPEQLTVSYLDDLLKTSMDKSAREMVQWLLKEHSVFSAVIHKKFSLALKQLCAVGLLLQSTLETGKQTLQGDFHKFLQINFFDLTYKAFDMEFGDAMEPVINEVCLALNDPESFEEETENLEDNEEYVAICKELFKMYLCVKQFSDLSLKLDEDQDLLIASSFHSWFQPGICHLWETVWVVISKSLKRAVEADKSNEQDEMSDDKIQGPVSYPAVSVASVFNQVPSIWKDLSWPNADEAFNFLLEILSELWKYTRMYAELTVQNIHSVESANNEPVYYISHQVCRYVNNIKYVLEEGLLRVMELLNIDDIILSLSIASGVEKSSAAVLKLKEFKENCQETIQEHITKIFKKSADRMNSEILKLMVESTESVNGDHESYLTYLDKNLGNLKFKLPPCTFQIAFWALWQENLNVMSSLIQLGINKLKPAHYYERLEGIFSSMRNLFFVDETDRNVCSYPLRLADTQPQEKEIESLLGIHKANIRELKLMYYGERWTRQSGETTHGVLTFRAKYSEETATLAVDVLSAKNLKSYDSDGLSDPYVEVTVVPQEAFRHVTKMSTSVKKATLFPLFDESFTINVTLEEMKSGGFLAFAVYDYDYIGKNDFHGEAFLPLSTVFRTGQHGKTAPPQMHLNLDKPCIKDNFILETMEKRQCDKLTVRFVKEERSKMDIK